MKTKISVIVNGKEKNFNYIRHKIKKLQHKKQEIKSVNFRIHDNFYGKIKLFKLKKDLCLYKYNKLIKFNQNDTIPIYFETTQTNKNYIVLKRDENYRMYIDYWDKNNMRLIDYFERI